MALGSYRRQLGQSSDAARLESPFHQAMEECRVTREQSGNRRRFHATGPFGTHCSARLDLYLSRYSVNTYP
jgi:hypothetical protein